MKTVCDIPYLSTPHERAYLDLYLPDGDINGVVVYFHGGGLISGSKGIHIGLSPLLESDGLAVVTPNYRLYPNAKYPDYLYDAAAACAWAKSHIGEYGNLVSDNFYISGSSAGGYISMMLYFDDKYLKSFGFSASDFSGYIFDAGQPTTHFSILNYDYKTDTRKIMVDEAAPIYHIAEYDGRPPVLIFVSDNDMHGRLSQTKVLIDTMTDYEYPEDKIILRLIENSTHCSYTCSSVFSDEISAFYKKTKR